MIATCQILQVFVECPYCENDISDEEGSIAIKILELASDEIVCNHCKETVRLPAECWERLGAE